jgi:hypothetical protein
MDGLSRWSPGFDPRPVHVRFVVDRLALRQVYIGVLRFYSVNIIPPMLHTRLHLYAILSRSEDGRSVETFAKATRCVCITYTASQRSSHRCENLAEFGYEAPCSCTDTLLSQSASVPGNMIAGLAPGSRARTALSVRLFTSRTSPS